MGATSSTPTAPYGTALNKLNADLNCTLFGQRNVIPHTFTVTSPLALTNNQSFSYTDWTIEVDIPQNINQYFINQGATQYSANTLVEWYSYNTGAGVVTPRSSVSNVSLTTSSTLNFPGGNGVIPPITTYLQYQSDTALFLRVADTDVTYFDANGNAVSSKIEIDCGRPLQTLELSRITGYPNGDKTPFNAGNGAPGIFPTVGSNQKATVAHVPIACRDGEGLNFPFNVTIAGVVDAYGNTNQNYYINQTTIYFTVPYQNFLSGLNPPQTYTVAVAFGQNYDGSATTSPGFQLNFTDNGIANVASTDVARNFSPSDASTAKPLRSSKIATKGQDVVIRLPTDGVLSLGPFNDGKVESTSIITAALSYISGSFIVSQDDGNGVGKVLAQDNFYCTAGTNQIFSWAAGGALN